MQDRDFDQLFKDRFEKAELQPSTDLWGKIAIGLEPKKRTSIPVFWVAASVALVLITIGLLFNKTEKVRLQGTVPLAENLPAVPVGKATMLDASVEVEPHTGVALVIAPSIDINYPEVLGPSRKTDRKISVAVQPAEGDTRLNDIQVATNEPVQKREGWRSDTDVIANLGTEINFPDAVVNENDQIEKKGIRNVGDLVNFVVEKVDKRDQKFLKFNTDDDDNSSLVGINIGFIKLNSRKHQ